MLKSINVYSRIIHWKRCHLRSSSINFCKKVNVPLRVSSSIDPFRVPESSS